MRTGVAAPPIPHTPGTRAPWCRTPLHGVATPVKGSLVAMAVFVERWLPPLKAAEGQRYYLLQSPDDTVTPLVSAETAKRALEAHGATVKLQPYPGGHGWHGDTMAMVREGVRWLEEGEGGGEAGR